MPEETTEKSPASRKLPKKTLLVILGLMLAEGVGVYFLVSMSGGSSTSATVIQGTEEAERQQTQEISLLEDRFPNVDTGVVWLWDTSIVLQVRKKNADRVTSVIEQRQAEIHEGISQIFRRASDRQLRNDPGLDTITRQITAYLNDVFGTDKDDLPLIERVIIPKCTGINAGG